MPVSGLAAISAPDTSPCGMNRIRVPTARIRLTISSWRGRSRITTIRSRGRTRLARATVSSVSSIGAFRSSSSSTSGAAGELLHVDAGAGVEHRLPVAGRDHGQRVGLALRAQLGALQRVDRDVDRDAVAGADPLAVEQHRRLVLLALADHDDAVHLDRRQHVAHGVDGGLVGRDLVAEADPAGRGQRGRLGHADQLEREVAVGSFGHGR